MNRNQRINIIVLLSSILVSLLSINPILRLFDPLGIYRYHRDISILQSTAIPDVDRGYTLATGTVEMNSWTVTIDDSGNRLMPDTNINGNCRIAVIGDSVTFGQGVDDYAVWVNQIARLYPDIYFINTAKPGYNAGNFSGVIKTTPANGYLYLAIDNDFEPPAVWERRRKTKTPSVLEIYLYHLAYAHQRGYTYADQNGIAPIYARTNLLAVGFEEYRVGQTLAASYPQTKLIPLWTSSISWADPHPDAIGHLEIADYISPYVSRFLNTVCFDKQTKKPPG